MTPKEERARLFGIVWELAMEAAAPPIATYATRVPAKLAAEARQLLADMGYDWQAALTERRQKVRHYRR